LPAAFFLLGFLGRLHWVLDLFSHFRAQYAASLLLCGLAFLLLRHWKSATVSLLAGVVVLATFLPIQQAFPPDLGVLRLKLISYNVNTANPRHGDVLRFLEAENADVIFLMEVNEAWMQSLRALDGKYPHRLVSTREDNFGMALYSKQPFEGGKQAFGDYGLPWADITVSGLRLLAVHPMPPSGAEHSEMRNQQLFEAATALKGQPRAILCGDLNLTPYSPWFREILAHGELHNSSPPWSPTWMRHYPLFAIPIDHILLGPGLTLASRRVGPALGSDHNAVVAEIAEKQESAPPQMR
jgi:endonuclease/exonuclease/phosphatase (EEP) superfamily protein YafD